MSEIKQGNNHHLPVDINDLLFNISDKGLIIVDSQGVVIKYNNTAEQHIWHIAKIKVETNLSFLRVMSQLFNPFGEDFYALLQRSKSYSFEILSDENEMYRFTFYLKSVKPNIQFLITVSNVSDEYFKIPVQTYAAKIIEHISDAIVVTNNDLDNLKILFVNPAFTKITGYTYDEAKNRNPSFLQGKRTDVKVIAKLRKDLSEGNDFFGSTYNYRKNGEEFVNEWRITPLKNGKGDIQYFIAIIRDVSVREELREEVGEKENLLQSVFESMAEGIIIQNQKGETIDYNKSAQKILGLSLNQFDDIGSHVLQWTPYKNGEEKYTPHDQPIVRSRESGEVINNEIVKLSSLNGQVKWLSINSRPLIKNNILYGAFATFQDITKKVLTNWKLEESENKYRTLFNDNPNPVLITEANDGKIIDANAEALSFYGYSKEELREKALAEFIDTPQEKGDESKDIIHLAKSKKLYVNDYVKKINIDDKELEIHQIHNITDRKVAEEELLKRQRQIEVIMKNSPMLIYVTDLRGSIEMVYGDLMKIMGLKSDDLIGRNIIDVYQEHWDDEKDHSKFNAFKNSLNSSHKSRNKNNTVVLRWNQLYLQSSFSNLINEYGKNIGIIGVVADISEIHKVKNELQNKAGELFQSQKIAKVGSWSWDPENDHVHWSKISKKIHGVTLKFHPTLKSMANFFYKEDKKVFKKAWNDLLKNRKKFDHELRIQTNSGRVLWVRVIGDYNEVNGKVVKLFGVYQDINIQKQLLQERLRYDKILQLTTNEVFIYHAKTLNANFLNKSALDNLGYKVSDIKSLKATDLMHGYDQIRFESEILNLVSKKDVKGKFFQFQHIRKNGSYYDVEATVQLMELQHEPMIVILANDITAKNREKRKSEIINKTNELIVSNQDKNKVMSQLLEMLATHLDCYGGEYWGEYSENKLQQVNNWSNQLHIKQRLVVNRQKKLLKNDGFYKLLNEGGKIQLLTREEYQSAVKDSMLNISMFNVVAIISLYSKNKLHGFINLYSLNSKVEIEDFKEALAVVSGQVSQYLTGKIIERELIKFAEEKEVLLKEIHHRVKNNLQAVSSLLYIKSKEMKDKGMASFLNNTQNRIASISYIHEKLLKTNQFDVIDIKSYLEDLIINIYHTHIIEGNDIELDINIESHVLPTDIVMNCGLIANELFTNSLQHAFTNQDKGIVKVHFIKQNLDFIMIIEDNGNKSEALKNPGSSIGLQLVDIFVSQLKGSLTSETDNGLKYHIKFQL